MELVLNPKALLYRSRNVYNHIEDLIRCIWYVHILVVFKEVRCDHTGRWHTAWYCYLSWMKKEELDAFHRDFLVPVITVLFSHILKGRSLFNSTLFIYFFVFESWFCHPRPPKNAQNFTQFTLLHSDNFFYCVSDAVLSGFIAEIIIAIVPVITSGTASMTSLCTCGLFREKYMIEKLIRIERKYAATSETTYSSFHSTCTVPCFCKNAILFIPFPSFLRHVFCRHWNRTPSGG